MESIKVIEDLVENYKKNPEEGMAGWSSSIKWKDGFYAEAQVDDHKPEVNSLEVNASGQLDLNVFLGLKEGNPGFKKINVQFIIDSGADDKQLEELVSKAMEISPM
ncbi:hypothetical protein [Bacillus spizizenii]|uniref:hypothetical protein n=1 Tax=Bacillus spizizenii TaxID=96241 RepID=UPI003982117F